jgi:hypothetical protein
VKVVERFAARHGSDELRILNAAGNAGIEAATNIVVREANVAHDAGRWCIWR